MMKDSVLLAQTDTTVGFLSQNASRLSKIKVRSVKKPFLKIYADLKTFKQYGRIPNTFKRQVRRSKATSYVVKGTAFRIVSDPVHQHIIRAFGWLYSTSANLSGHTFERKFAEHHSDIIIEDKRGLHEHPPSTILKLGSHQIKRLR